MAKKVKKVKKAKKPESTLDIVRFSDTMVALIEAIDANTNAINRMSVLIGERDGLLSTREIAETDVTEEETREHGNP